LSVAFRSTDVSASPARNRAEGIVATDGELLMRFVRQRDHGAFAQIVERHGRLVWMICRQVLRHHQDVEDAFQATFLILAERAQTIRASDSAAAWLFGVAQRTSLAARRKRSRRREESLVDEPPVGEESVRAIDNREMLYVLLREIDNLPARYQAPLVMRYLEGQSRRAIAEQTDSTVGQIQGRLVRGRRLLRSRFLRRGVSLSLAAGAAAGTAASAEAAVTTALIDSTAETCLQAKTSGTMSGLPPAVLALVHEGVKAMWFTFVTKCTAIATATFVAAGIVWAAQQGDGNGKNATGPTAANRINMRVAAAGDVKGNQGPTATVDPNASQPSQEAARQQEQYTQKLKSRIEDLDDELRSKMNARSDKAARLEMEQIEKTSLQRELEHLRGMLLELDLPTVTPSDEKVTKEAQQKRLEAREKVAARLESVKQQLDKLTLDAALMTSELELRQLGVTRTQRRLEELDRRSIQLEFPDEVRGHVQASAATAPAVADVNAKQVPYDVIRVPTDVENQQVRIIEQVQREQEALKKENADLKKQLEQKDSSSKEHVR
jgi:RNA polymerase sigma factor (sigma-70 family)